MEERNNNQGMPQQGQGMNQQEHGSQQQQNVSNQKSGEFNNPQKGSQWDNYQTRTLSGGSQEQRQSGSDLEIDE